MIFAAFSVGFLAGAWCMNKLWRLAIDDEIRCREARKRAAVQGKPLAPRPGKLG